MARAARAVPRLWQSRSWQRDGAGRGAEPLPPECGRAGEGGSTDLPEMLGQVSRVARGILTLSITALHVCACTGTHTHCCPITQRLVPVTPDRSKEEKKCLTLSICS